MRNLQRSSWSWLSVGVLPLVYLLIFGIFTDLSTFQGLMAIYRTFAYSLCFILQIALYVFLLRSSGRSLGRVLGSFFLATIYIVIMSSGYPTISLTQFPVTITEVRGAIDLLIVPFLVAQIVRHFPGRAVFRDFQLVKWRGIVLILTNVFSVLVLIFLVTVLNNITISLIAFALVFIINLLISWKPAGQWWRESSRLTALFAIAGTAVVIIYLATQTFPSTTISQTPIWTVLVVVTTGFTLVGAVLLSTALGMLSAAGLRFAFEHFPTPARILNAGLADWRGLVFLGLLIVNIVLVLLNVFLPGTISLDAAGPIFAIYMMIVVILYWHPASRWQDDHKEVYLFSSIAIFATVIFVLVAITYIVFQPNSNSVFFKILNSLLNYHLVSACASALVAFLPWLKKQWTERLPVARNQVSFWKLLLGLFLVDYVIVYLAKSGTLFYPLLAGAFTLAGGYIIAPRLARWQRSQVVAGFAAVLLVVSLVGILAVNQWLVSAYNSNWLLFGYPIFDSTVFVGWLTTNLIVFTLPLLGVLCLGVLLSHRIAVRLALAFSILISAETIIIFSNFALDESGLATGIAWLAIFSAGWLISGLLPARVENWVVTFASGFFLLCLSPLLLPLIDDKTDLFSYPVSLPVWSSHQTINAISDVVRVFLPVLLSVTAGTLFFALMVRSGEAMLKRSRTPRPEIVTLGLLILGAFLTLASSYRPTTVDFASMLGSDGWQAISGGASHKEKPTFLLADPSKRVWLGGLDGSEAWVMLSDGQTQTEPVYLSTETSTGVIQVSIDGTGWIWALTDRELAALDPDSAKVIFEYNRGQLANELGLTPESLEFFTFFPDTANQYWLGTSQGLVRLEFEQRVDRLVLEDVSLRLPLMRVMQIGRDSQGHFWMNLPDQKKLLVELPSTGQMARSFPAGSGSLQFRLDLTRIPAGTPLSLNLNVHLGVDASFSVQARSSDGEFQCLTGVQASEILPGDKLNLTQSAIYQQSKDTCQGVSANLLSAVTLRYPLDVYAGTSTVVQINPASGDFFAGDWLLFGAWVSETPANDPVYGTLGTPGSTQKPIQVLFSPEFCTTQGTQCVSSEVPQAMLLANSSRKVFVWDSPTGPVYAPLSYDPVSNTYDNNPLLYHHAGLVGMVSTPIQQEKELIKNLFISDQDQALALTDVGLRQLNSETGKLEFGSYLQSMPLFDVSDVMFQGERLWVAGKMLTSSLVSQGAVYAIGRYDQQEDQWVVLHNNIPVGTVNQMALDANNSIWALFQDKTYRPNSVWWFIFPLLGFIAVGVREFAVQPPTLAARLRRRLRQQPQQALPILYEVIRTERTPGLILSLLPSARNTPTDQAWLPLSAAMLQVAPDQPLPQPEQLLSIAETLEKASAPPEAAVPNGAATLAPAGAAGLGMLYRFLSSAFQVKSIQQIAAWSLHILRTQTADQPPMLTSETQQPQPVPDWIDSYTVDTLDVLSNIAAKIKNYQEVDSSQDKLVYLADAVTAAGEALHRTDSALLPEKTLLRAIATDWKEMVHDELNNYSGRARLRLELRTRQIRRAAQVTVALRLTNTGRAVAEFPTVVLLPGDGYAIAGADKTGFERISSGGSALAEFTIVPKAEEEARIVCQVTWTDRVRQENVFQFADKIRFYRQAGEFQSIPNPYIAGNPLKTPDLFRGREDVFQFVNDSLGGPVQDRTLVLFGQRRTGKTSVLYQLLGGRLGPQFIPVLVDMQEMAPLINGPADLFNELEYLIVRALKEKANLDFPEPDIKDFQENPARTFKRFLDKMGDQLANRRVVLLLDEFEILESKINEGKLEKNLLDFFRGLIQHSSLVFIFTGTHRLEEMSHDYWSVLFNLALYKRISYLSQEDAARVVREPVGDTLNYDELAVEKILNLTHCHPYFTQLICFNLVNLCNQQKRNYATLNDVNDAVQEVIENGEAHFAYIWQRASEPERAALAGLAHTLGPGCDWASPREIQDTLSQGGYARMAQKVMIEALDGLVSQEVLESTGDGALRYRFQIELIQRWIAANKSVAALAERDK